MFLRREGLLKKAERRKEQGDRRRVEPKAIIKNKVIIKYKTIPLQLKGQKGRK